MDEPERAFGAATSGGMIGIVPPDPRMLWDLVDAGDLDSLFSIATLADMARSWINVQHREDSSDDIRDDDPDWWVLELWWSSAWWTDDNTERIRAGMLALVEAAETDDDLGLIGAGPLEGFVSDNAADLEWLESECAKSPKLRRALADVWCSDNVSEATLDRLDAAAGVSLARHLQPRAW
jgi:hypothetical protein